MQGLYKVQMRAAKLINVRDLPYYNDTDVHAPKDEDADFLFALICSI